MDTTPARGPTETPRMDRINPPAMEKPSKRRWVDGVKSKNGKKLIQQPMKPPKSKNQLKKETVKYGSWNIRRGVWKQEMELRKDRGLK